MSTSTYTWKNDSAWVHHKWVYWVCHQWFWYTTHESETAEKQKYQRRVTNIVHWWVYHLGGGESDKGSRHQSGHLLIFWHLIRLCHKWVGFTTNKDDTCVCLLWVYMHKQKQGQSSLCITDEMVCWASCTALQMSMALFSVPPQLYCVCHMWLCQIDNEDEIAG